MTLFMLTLWLLLLRCHHADGMRNLTFSVDEIDRGVALRTLASQASQNLKNQAHTAPSCGKDNVQQRREWRDLPRNKRIEFTDAIQCLQSLPTNISADARKAFPAVESRYDEYVAVHIQMSEYIHFTASFFAWHRYFIHRLEQDLRDKCNYTSSLPYWEWGNDAFAPQDSSVFSGEPDSMGSNGAPLPDREPRYWASNKITVPIGTGGGCVYSGPFANSTVKMGPIDAPGLELVKDKFDYNPRCLTRDLNPTVMSTSNTFRNSTELLLHNDRIEVFQGVLQHDNRFAQPELTYALHGGGHIGVGLVMGDVQASPSDPVFWIHHAQIDRIWTIWQGIDPQKRLAAISGTHTYLNKPPTRNMTLDDMLDFGFIAQPIKFRDLMNTQSGPFCYEYV